MKREFKVGDKVKCFGPSVGHIHEGRESITGVVSSINPEGYSGFLQVEIDCASVRFHHKQCRRLVPKKRREIFINEYAIGGRLRLNESHHETLEEAEAKALHASPAFIRTVRFVEAK
jgi:hypothetical protein